MSDFRIKRSIQELEDIRFALDSLLETHRKPHLNDRVFDVWMDVLRQAPTKTILESVRKCAAEQQYAPTPQIIYQLCQKNPRHSNAPENANEKIADPKIEKAWVMCMRVFHAWAPADKNPDIELNFEQALIICNEQAAKFDMPDAIPDKYKLSEYWPDLNPLF